MHRARKTLRVGFLIARGLTLVVAGAVQDEIKWRRSRSALDAEAGMAAWFATIFGEIHDRGARANPEDAGTLRSDPWN